MPVGASHGGRGASSAAAVFRQGASLELLRSRRETTFPEPRHDRPLPTTMQSKCHCSPLLPEHVSKKHTPHGPRRTPLAGTLSGQHIHSQSAKWGHKSTFLINSGEHSLRRHNMGGDGSQVTSQAAPSSRHYAAACACGWHVPEAQGRTCPCQVWTRLDCRCCAVSSGGAAYRDGHCACATHCLVWHANGVNAIVCIVFCFGLHNRAQPWPPRAAP